MRKLIRLLALAAAVPLLVSAQAPAPPPASPPAAVPLPPPTAAPAAPAAVTPSPLSSLPQAPKLSPMGDKPDWSKLEIYRGALDQKDFEAALREVYTDGSAFPPPWQLSPDSVSIDTGNSIQPTVRVDFHKPSAPAVYPPRFWKRIEEQPPLNGRPLLSDLHIALDPGHIGGSFAKMEERFLSFAPGEAVQEGDLALLTAQILKARLEALGARVSLVRDQAAPVTELRPADFRQLAISILREAGVSQPVESYDGSTGEAKVLTVQWQSEKLFYRVSEIRARARKANETIKPDMVICLHFNAESWGDAQQPQFSPENHLHVMINGCVSPVELALEDVRFEMFRRLFARMHEQELPLAEAIAKGLAESTGLPPYVYTTNNARRAGASPHVVARNLLANRLYNCPVVYLEPFVMNHERTYRRLLAGHFIGRTLIGGQLQRSAIEEYAQGVVSGLTALCKTKRVP